MSSKYFVYPDIKNRIFFEKKEVNYIILKSFSFEMQFTNEIFIPFYKKLYSSSPRRSKVRNKCMDTRRSRAVLGKYHFSRFPLVKLFSTGKYPGIRKASW